MLAVPSLVRLLCLLPLFGQAGASAPCDAAGTCEQGEEAPTDQVGLLQVGGRRKLEAEGMMSTDTLPACLKGRFDDLKLSACAEAHYASYLTALKALGGHGVENQDLAEALFCEQFAKPMPRRECQPCQRKKCVSKKSWVKSMMTPGVEYKTFPTHTRHDNFAPGCPNQTLVADWTRETRLRRYLPQLDETFPDQVLVNTTQKYIDTVTSVLSADGGEFTLTSDEQLESVRHTISRVDWNDAIIHVYAAPPDNNGDTYSPAFNSIFIVWKKCTRQLSHYMVIAADAEGKPLTKYVGNAFDETFESITGDLFTPLTDSTENPLHYSLPKYNPLHFDVPFLFDIWVWHVEYPEPDHWYIEVATKMECTTDCPQVPAHEQVAAKEYYMADIATAYYGGIPPNDLVKNLQGGLPHQHLEACQPVDEEYSGHLKGVSSADDTFPWIRAPTCVAK